MPIPKGDKYWAQWAYEFCEMARISPRPNVEYAKLIGVDHKTVASQLSRLRRKGFISPSSEGTYLTERAKAILSGMKLDPTAKPVVFDMRVRARSKAEALAEVWDVITQLEHWDPRNGEPFRLSPARLRNLGLGA